MSYLDYRRNLKLTGKPSADDSRKAKKEKADFFTEMLKKVPAKCQNCGKGLAGTMLINPSAVCAHILPKSEKQGVPSMANNPLNIVYLCGDCHTNFDNFGCDFTTQMKIYPLLRERVAQMFPEIQKHERKRVPECLKP